MTVRADHPSRSHRREWRALREAVLARAENRCECTDQCDTDGHPWPPDFRCDAPHGRDIIRHPDIPEIWSPHSHDAECVGEGCRAVRAVLTLAHLDAEGGPCRCSPPCLLPEHVRALCQRCHLLYDRERHRRTAARTRRARHPTLPGVEP